MSTNCRANKLVAQTRTGKLKVSPYTVYTECSHKVIRDTTCTVQSRQLLEISEALIRANRNLRPKDVCSESDA